MICFEPLVVQFTLIRMRPVPVPFERAAMLVSNVAELLNVIPLEVELSLVTDALETAEPVLFVRMRIENATPTACAGSVVFRE
jgi:hypothetical protein